MLPYKGGGGFGMQGLAETLLTLDMPGRICGPDMKPGQRVKLSPLGCAMLATLLSFPQVRRTRGITSSVPACCLRSDRWEQSEISKAT